MSDSAENDVPCTCTWGGHAYTPVNECPYHAGTEKGVLAREAAERLREAHEAIRRYRKALERAREGGVTYDDLHRARSGEGNADA